MFGLLTHAEQNIVINIHRFLATARLVSFTIVHGFRFRLRNKPLYYGKMWPMRSKLQLWCYCRYLKILYTMVATCNCRCKPRFKTAVFLWSEIWFNWISKGAPEIVGCYQLSRRNFKKFHNSPWNRKKHSIMLVLLGRPIWFHCLYNVSNV
jgi:hypothetical protein